MRSRVFRRSIIRNPRKKTITNITSQILDPEGKVAQVGDNSGIIYRIDKQINTDLNFAKSVMEGVYTKK